MRRLFWVIIFLIGSLSSCISSFGQTDTQLLSRLNRHCLEKAKEAQSGSKASLRIDAFFSPETYGCVVSEVDDAGWSYVLRDFTHSLFVAPKWVKVDSKLHVFHEREIGTAYMTGYWQSTDEAPDKQLVGQIAVKIFCSYTEKVCHETDATILMGLEADTHDYSISRWNEHGIIADDTDEGPCSIGHRLSINFDTSSVTVTDYPKSIGGKDCKAFQNANSYALHGGDILMFGEDQIFSCTKDGANSAIVRRVADLHGDVGKTGYSVWMDDGNGGKPAAIETPKHPFTRDDCQSLMDKKIAELKAW